MNFNLKNKLINGDNLKELKKIKNCNIYATISNADTMHNKFSEILFEFEKENNNFKLYHSLNYFDYLFILKNCKFIIDHDGAWKKYNLKNNYHLSGDNGWI